ncbi:hypothetical protein Tco_0613951 [Tanacetum coccineum]
MDGVDIEDLTIKQYLRLTHESQTPKKIEDMTIAEYLEYKKMMNINHISNAKSYFPTYFTKSTPTNDPIVKFAHSFGPNPPDTESDYDSKDLDEEVEYMTDDEVIMNEQEERYTQNTQHLEEKDDVDKWLNIEITKHMSMQGVENMKDALISIIKSIKQEMKDEIMKKQFEASTTSISNETSSITSNEVDKADTAPCHNEVDKDDNNTSNTAPCQLLKELSPGSFLLPFNINNHSFYAITTLNAKDNIMPLKVYEYLSLDKFKGTSTVENNIRTDDPLGTVDIMCIEKIYMVDIGHEEETFNTLEIGIDLFFYESPTCLEFEQRTRSYGTPNPQDEIAEPINCGMWLTCDPGSKFCFGYKEVFRVNEQGTLRMWICFRDHERRTVKGSYMGFADFLQISFEVGDEIITFDLEKSMRFPPSDEDTCHSADIIDLSILDNIKEILPQNHDNSIEPILDHLHFFMLAIPEDYEYELGVGKKGHILDHIWEYCNQVHSKNYEWHSYEFENEECEEIGIEDKDYHPPEVQVETLDVKKYSFNGGQSFICVTKDLDNTLPLGRKNGSKIQKLGGNYRDRLDSLIIWYLAESAAVTA